MIQDLTNDARNYLRLGCGDRTAPRVPDGPRHREAIMELRHLGLLDYQRITPTSDEYLVVTDAGHAVFENEQPTLDPATAGA